MAKQNRHIHEPVAWVEAELRLAGTLDSRMIGLLQAVQQSGSINQAAKQVGLSYKGAWQMIERANNLAPKVLVATATGGSKGGGTILTAAGQSLLALYARVEQQHRQFLERLNHDLLNEPEWWLLLKSMAVKSSASNQLFGEISAIRQGAIQCEVDVQLKGGECITASMTHQEFAGLSLVVGQDVVLIIAPPEITLIGQHESLAISARNVLPATVIRVQQDAVDCEVVLRLAGGASLTALITRDGAQPLGLQEGTAVQAVFKSNAVLLAA